MVGLLDRLLGVLASLRLAIVVIVALATYLGVATFYEATYGAPAAQAMVYGSAAFVIILGLLAINVAAAVIVRFPWKRKQTGFIITHIGIEVLLIGCAVSMRQSVDGMLALAPGQGTDHLNLRSEHLRVAVAGEQAPGAWRGDWWAEAGYPGVIGFLLGREPTDAPTEPLARYVVNDKINVTLDRWLPAARLVRECRPGDGPAAAKLRLAGATPAGASVDEAIWLHATNNGGRVAQFAGGMIEAVLWTARTPAEIEQFLAPVDADALGASGVLRVYAGEKWHTIDVATALGKEGFEIKQEGSGVQGSGNAHAPSSSPTPDLQPPTPVLRVQVMDYLPAAMEDRDRQELRNAGPDPVNPCLVVKLHSKDAVDTYVVSARYPFNTRRQVSSTKSPEQPVPMIFDHPAMHRTRADSTPGRIELLSAGDRLFLRQFGLRGFMGSSEISAGEDVKAFMGLRLIADEYLPRAVYVEEYVPARVAPSRMADQMRAALVTVTSGSTQQQVWLARGAAPMQIETPAGPVALSYGFDAVKLPFTLSMLDARIVRDPGSTESGVFESRVRAVTDDGRVSEHAIGMNQPATIEGYTFYQQQMTEAPGLEHPISQLSVRRDAGWMTKYAGCALIVAGIFTMFYMKAYFARPRAVAEPGGEKRASRAPVAATAALLLMLLAAPSVALERGDPVLHDGRVMPADTLARQTVRFVTGKEHFQKHDPFDLLRAWQTEPADWTVKPILHVPHLELRDKVSAGQQWVAPQALMADKSFGEWTGALLKQQADADRLGEQAGLTALEEAALDLRQRLRVFEMARSGELIVPAPGSVDQRRLDIELAYNRLHPFRWAWIAYGVATLALLIGVARSRASQRGPLVLLAIAIVINAVAFAWRVVITGWAPVTNMYETVTWVAMISAVIALVLSIGYRSRGIAIAGAVTALVGGIIADVMPPALGREIASLTPALRSNFWLTIHVLTIVSSYAAFALACVLGNVWLARSMKARQVGESASRQVEEADQDSPTHRLADAPNQTTHVARSTQLIYRTLQIGVLLLAAGTILGGLWADQSWGRFWGWDPKEVWALVALLAYLALLHGRFAGWVGPFGLAAGSVLAFSTVLMSWYGVNFLLGTGLHSYGFGTGGEGWVAGYVGLQAVFVGAARIVWVQRGMSNVEWRMSNETQTTSDEDRALVLRD